MAEYRINVTTRGGESPSSSVWITPSMEKEDRQTLLDNESTKRLLPLFQTSIGDLDTYALEVKELEKRGAKGDLDASAREIMISAARRITVVLESAGVEVEQYLWTEGPTVERIAS